MRVDEAIYSPLRLSSAPWCDVGYVMFTFESKRKKLDGESGGLDAADWDAFPYRCALVLYPVSFSCSEVASVAALLPPVAPVVVSHDGTFSFAL